jgi:predicted nucleic acid-binding Zn ribbon protein
MTMTQLGITLWIVWTSRCSRSPGVRLGHLLSRSEASTSLVPPWSPLELPGADDRDPQPLGRLASRLVADRGWADRVSAGVVFARWPQLVGADVAGHSEPVSLHDGELLVRATSTAWATQLRLLQRQLLARIAAGVGPNVVTRLRIQGPTAPTWVHGHRHVRGRGPRDTYG